MSWWTLNEGAADRVGTNSGELIGASFFGAGKVGQSLGFDGVDDEVDIPASPSLDVGAGAGFTLELWINPADISKEHPMVEWNNRHGTVGLSLVLGVPVAGGAGSVLASLTDTSGVAHWLASAPDMVTANAWQHLAVTYDRSSGWARLYLDGAQIAEMNFGDLTVQTSYDLFFGRRVAVSGTNFRYTGDMDEVSLYSRALGPDEIQAIFAAGSAGKCALPPPPPTHVYDLADDFSSEQNPNGPWSYGGMGSLGGAFDPFTIKGVTPDDHGLPIEYWQSVPLVDPTIYYNSNDVAVSASGGQGVFPPGTVWVVPGSNGQPENYGAIRFTAPSNGNYLVKTAVRSLYEGALSRDADFHVLKNGEELFGKFLAPNSAIGYTNVVVLESGDTVDFAVGRGADGDQYASGLKIDARLTVTANPPPPLRLSIGMLLSVSPFQFRFACDPHGVYQLQATTNFVDWTPVATVTNNSKVWRTVNDPQARYLDHRFYRVIKQP